MNNAAIKAGTNVVIVKGCSARMTMKGQTYMVREVTELGADYSHMVRVVLVGHSRTISWTARHINRLSDDVVSLNDGNPCNKIQIRRA